MNDLPHRASSRHGFLSAVRPGEWAALAVMALALAVPLGSSDPLALSLTNQILVASIASFSVYIMLRMDLLSFALPAFMALGGYATAIASKAGLTSVPVLLCIAFAVPALVALPLGSLVLRLKGTYFVLVTFAFNEVLQLILFQAKPLTGGSNGITGLPPVTVFGAAVTSVQGVVIVSCATGVLAALATIGVTALCRRPFAAISENEPLAQSLGLDARRYKTIGFVVSAGVAGMAGFALVVMLLTAHPSSFTTMSGFSYIVFAIIGGRSSMLGPLLGAAVLTSATQLFSSRGEYSPALYGLLVILVVMLARDGIAGIRLPALLRPGRERPVPFNKPRAS